MAEKGHVKVIKNDTGNGGGIAIAPAGGDKGGTPVDTANGTGSAAAGSGTAATPPALTTVMVTVTSNRTGLDLNFNIPYHTAMTLNVGDLVRYETLAGKKGTADIPVYLERIPAGVVASIAADGASGVITERNSDKPVNFYQSHLAELGIKVGDNVKYTLIYTSTGETAVNVQEA
jgi:cold shock CspA family protein